KSFTVMIAAVAIENLAHAMGNVALVALIMSLCDVRFSAFQYALLSVLAQLPRYGLGGPAGWVADHGGWPVYYVVSFLLGIPGLGCSTRCRTRRSPPGAAAGTRRPIRARRICGLSKPAPPAETRSTSGWTASSSSRSRGARCSRRRTAQTRVRCRVIFSDEER